MATNEFGQPEYGLPKEHRKGLAALTNPDVDYSQYGQIVVATLRGEPTRTSHARKCGMDIKALIVFDRKKATSTKKLLEACIVGKEALRRRSTGPERTGSTNENTSNFVSCSYYLSLGLR